MRRVLSLFNVFIRRESFESQRSMSIPKSSVSAINLKREDQRPRNTSDSRTGTQGRNNTLSGARTSLFLVPGCFISELPSKVKSRLTISNNIQFSTLSTKVDRSKTLSLLSLCLCIHYE